MRLESGFVAWVRLLYLAGGTVPASDAGLRWWQAANGPASLGLERRRDSSDGTGSSLECWMAAAWILEEEVRDHGPDWASGVADAGAVHGEIAAHWSREAGVAAD